MLPKSDIVLLPPKNIPISWIWENPIKWVVNKKNKAKDELIKKIHSTLEDTDNPEMILSQLKDTLLKLNPTFSELNFGYDKFSSLINSIPTIEIIKNGRTFRVKKKDT